MGCAGDSDGTTTVLGLSSFRCVRGVISCRWGGLKLSAEAEEETTGVLKVAADMQLFGAVLPMEPCNRLIPTFEIYCHIGK